MSTTLALIASLAPLGDPHVPNAAPLGHLPLPTTSAGAALHDGSIYYLGGYTGRPHDYVIEDQSADFVRIDPRTGRVESLPEIGSIQGLALVSDGERLIQVGGLRIRNRRGEPQALESVAEVHAFDPHTKTWEALPSLPEPRSSHDAFVVDEQLWVVGGWALDPESETDTWHDTLLELDLSAAEPAWIEHPQPFERRALAVSAHGEHLIVLGGMDSWDDVSSETEVFNTRTREWTDGPELAGFGFGVSMAPSPAGVVASGKDGLLQRFAPGDEAWEPIGRLWMPRYFHRLVPDGAGGVIALGGIMTGGRPTLVEHLAADAPRTAELALEVPSPMAANNRQAMHLSRGRLTFIGGNNGTDQHDFAPERFEATSWSLNLANLTWEPRGSLPAPRQTGKLVDLGQGGLAYLGGFAHDGWVARAHQEVFLYDAGDDAWSEGVSLPAPRTQYGLAKLGNDVLLYGGLHYDPERDEGQRFQFPMEILKASAEGDLAFEPTGIEMPEQRRAFASTVHDGKVFIVGGMGPEFSEVTTNYVLEPADMSFTEIAAPPRGVRISANLVPVGGKLALVAGSYLADDRGRAQVIELYDPATDTWSDCPTRIEFGAGHVHSTAFGDRLLLATAQEEPGRVHLRLIDPFCDPSGSPARVGTLEASF
ncbi:MAG: hypothetical protein AAFZ65_00680 [Planctomycetota bacterium]